MLSEDLSIEITETIDLLGHECWVCTKDQANEIARAHRVEAWRIWLQAEVDKYMSADPETIQSIIDKKKVKPGPYLK